MPLHYIWWRHLHSLKASNDSVIIQKSDFRCFLWHPVFKRGCPCAVQSKMICLQRCNIKHTSKSLVFVRTCLCLWTLKVRHKLLDTVWIWLKFLRLFWLNLSGKMPVIWTQSNGSFPLAPVGIVPNLSVLYSRQMQKWSISVTLSRIVNAGVTWRYSWGLPQYGTWMLCAGKRWQARNQEHKKWKILVSSQESFVKALEMSKHPV